MYVISTNERGMKKCRRTMGDYTFPAAVGEGGGKVYLVFNVVTEPDLG